nr:TOMM precursor leader peptide-binding protein [Ktedonobacteraceae bacterium]
MYHATVILGPLCTIGAGHSPCPLCLERRWLAIRPREEQGALDTLQQALVIGANARLIPSTLELIWTVVEGTLYENALPKPSVDKNWLYALHLDSLCLTRHELIADSSCPTCAHPEPDTEEAAVLHLSSHIKRETSESRLIKPLEYELPEDGYVNPACGMLGSISTVDRLHTVTAPVTGKFLLRNKYELYDVWWGGHSTNFSMSRRIGILEGLERYSGHWSRAKKVTVIDSYQNLAPDALDPRTCGLYHPDLYEAAYPYTMPFSVERKSSWVWGYSFQQARPILVPEQLAYYAGPTDDSPPYVHDCSNGCAIGSCIEEAILFGLLELIERDNFLLCWYAKLSPPRIDPWSSRSLSTLRLLDRIDLMGYDMHFLDTRLDTQIPTITAVAVKREDSYGKLVLAAGVGLDPEDAIRGALCEVAAYVATIGDRVQKNLAQLRTLAGDFSKVNSLDQHPLIYGLPEMAKHAEFLLQNPHISSVEEAYKTQMAEHPLNRDLLDDLQSCIDIILKLGMDVIVVDQTCPELEGTGLKVASVIVPGLMPIDFGWGRQRVFTLPRLRTVPRTAGFLSRDFDPALLNLTPHPFP